ncbi:MAG: ATPase [Eubacteriales bacterium]|nr:ATPase [Eubacteriales bacterium]
MKRLLILSGKGGTGKTTTAAAFIKLSGARAVADCDVDAPNLHLINRKMSDPVTSDFYGGEKAFIDSQKCTSCESCIKKCRFKAIEKDMKGSYIVNEFLCEGCGVCEYVCSFDAVRLEADIAGKKSLYFNDGVFSTAELKMGRGNSGKLVTEVKLAMLKNAKDEELAIVDGSPGTGCPVMASMSGMDMILIVAEPSYSGLSDLKRLIKTCSGQEIKLAVCVNKYNISTELTKRIKDFCEENAIPFVGVIPYDDKAQALVNQGRSLVEVDCPSGNALRHIYEGTMALLYK